LQLAWQPNCVWGDGGRTVIRLHTRGYLTWTALVSICVRLLVCGHGLVEAVVVRVAGRALLSVGYHIRRHSLIHSLSPCAGATVGKMPCLAISATTTAYGRQMINATREWVQVCAVQFSRQLAVPKEGSCLACGVCCLAARASYAAPLSAGQAHCPPLQCSPVCACMYLHHYKGGGVSYM
jgi:hypothetical protein